MFSCISRERPSFTFCPWKKDHVFGKKEISSFPIIQERSYSSAIFFERPSFQDVWKRKYGFPCRKRSKNRFPKTFRNIYNISSLFIACTKHTPEVSSFPCIPCQRGTYTLNNESLNTSSFQKISTHSKSEFYLFRLSRWGQLYRLYKFLIFTWILFFPLALKVSFSVFMKKKLSFSNFFVCLIILFAAVTNYCFKRRVVSVDLQKSRNTYNVKDILK